VSPAGNQLRSLYVWPRVEPQASPTWWSAYATWLELSQYGLSRAGARIGPYRSLASAGRFEIAYRH